MVLAAMTLLTDNSPSPPGDRPFHEATIEDVRYCYRLLLRREPDPQGWTYWQELLEKQPLTIDTLVDDFLNRPEFRRLQAEASHPHLLELTDFKLYVRLNDRQVGAVIARDRVYEPHVTGEIQRLLRPGHVFLDIGANVGYYTIMAGQLVGAQGHVIAFEPNLQNCELIHRSVAANGLTNVMLHPYALAEARETLRLAVGEDSTRGRLLDKAAGQPLDLDVDVLPVEAVVLDDYLGALPQLDVVKMDIEGAEPRALRGMTQLVRQLRPVIVTDFSPYLIQETSRTAPESFVQALLDLDYQVRVLPASGEKLPPMMPAQIMTYFAAGEETHLDLVATPVEGG